MASITAVLTKVVRNVSITACCGYCFLNFVAEPIMCSGPSMEPTIRDKDILLTDRFSSVIFKNFNRGDIVIARSPSDPKKLICKRIAGVSGDVVSQGFISHKMVPNGHVWLRGDNASNSSDSREFGPLPIGLIIGRATVRIWPPSRFSIITRSENKPS